MFVPEFTVSRSGVDRSVIQAIRCALNGQHRGVGSLCTRGTCKLLDVAGEDCSCFMFVFGVLCFGVVRMTYVNNELMSFFRSRETGVNHDSFP